MTLVSSFGKVLLLLGRLVALFNRGAILAISTSTGLVDKYKRQDSHILVGLADNKLE